MNKQRFNYLDKFQQLSQNQDENNQVNSFRNDINQIPSSRANFESQQPFQRIFVQNVQNFQNFGTFNNQLHHESTNIQQFESIRPQIQLGEEPAFSKISENPSQYSEIIHQNNLQQRNIADLSTQQKLIINKRKSILEGFSRVKTSQHRQSFIEESHKNQNDTYLQNQLSRMTEKKSFVINDNQHQQAQNNSKSFLIRDNQVERYEQKSLRHSKTSNIKNEPNISISKINHKASISHDQQNNQCKTFTSPNSNQYESNNSSNYASNSYQNLQVMKNFIENKSQQVKDLQTYLVKEFQEIQNQKQKHRHLSIQMNQLLNRVTKTQNQHQQYRDIINSELKQFQRAALINIESLAKRFMKQLFKVKIQSDQKTQTIKEKQFYIQELQKRVKAQQEKIESLSKKQLEKKQKVSIQPPANKFNEMSDNRKIDLLSSSIKNKNKQQIASEQQNQKSGSKFQRSKSKNNRYDYFKHFQKQMSQQLINQRSSRTCQFRPFDSPSKLQDDYDHRLQRLLQQVQERQNMVKGKTNSNLKFSNNNYNKNEYLLHKNHIQKTISPLKQSNNELYLKKRSSPRSPSNFSPKINKSVSISNINNQKSINRKQQYIENQNKQSYHDRKKYIKDKIERIKSMKQNQKTIDVSKYQEKQYKNYGYTKAPRVNQGFDYSPSKNPIHIKSTYILCEDRTIQNQQTDLSHSYSQSKMGSSFNKSKIRHSNIGYQYPDRSVKNKASMGVMQYSRGEERLTPSKVSSVYMMGMNTKNVSRF